MKKGRLHLLCGKMASGKSTLASQLAMHPGVLLIGEDDLLNKLYPNEVVDVQTYAKYSTRIKSALSPRLAELLQFDIQLVLDFPANTKDQRSWLFDLTGRDESRTELHYLECSDKLCMKRLELRAITDPERARTDTVEMFEAITRYFEPPSINEGIVITVHEQTGSAE